MNLTKFCNQVRQDIIFQIGKFGVGHIGGSLSIVEMLAVLYNNHMNVNPNNPRMENRDRLVVSKGHAGPAVYATLCNIGFFDRSWLSTLNKPGTNLPSHCDMNKTPGIDMTAGSLGQGLSCAVGMALAARLKKRNYYVYCILGDGECQEGQVWEAAMFASHQKLDNLICFIDYNKMQIDGYTHDVCSLNPLVEKWKLFGWNSINVENGNSCDEIDFAINQAKLKKGPSMIVANTIKGFGVPFVQNAGVSSHSMKISREQMDAALKELRGS